MNKLTTMLLTLMFISTSLALSCQYTEQVLSANPVNHLYDKSGNLYENVLNIYDFQNGAMNWGSCIWTGSFKVMNQINSEISVKINYKLQYSECIGNNPGIIEQTQELNISSFSSISVPVSDRACCNIRILNDSLTYEFLTNAYTTSVWEKVPIAVCKTCENGRRCLDDYLPCNSNSECGSSVCNIAKICGAVGTSFIVDCPNGLLNCNDKSCLEPSIKQVGEAFLCNWECISSYGEKGICKENPGINTKNNIIFWVIILFVFGISSYLIVRAFNKKPWQKKTQKLEKELDELKKRVDDKRKELKQTKEKQKTKQELETLIREEKEKREEWERIRLTKYRNKQGYPVYLNENGYEVFADSGNLFHIWWFKHNHKREIKPGHEIHHKDFDKENNDISNLEELTLAEHGQKHLNKYK